MRPSVCPTARSGRRIKEVVVWETNVPPATVLVLWLDDGRHVVDPPLERESYAAAVERWALDNAPGHRPDGRD